MTPKSLTTQIEIAEIIDLTTAVGTLMDEITLLRVSLRLYLDGYEPADAVAKAAEMMANSLTQNPRP